MGQDTKTTLIDKSDHVCVATIRRRCDEGAIMYKGEPEEQMHAMGRRNILATGRLKFCTSSQGHIVAATIA